MAQPAEYPRPNRGPADEFVGMRPTRQRRAVLQVVENLGVFSSAQTIHEALESRGERVGLSTVYRSLQLLAEHGPLDSVRGQDGEVLYRRCADTLHHHLVCRVCGDTEEIPGDPVSRLVRHWSKVAGYAEVEHALEMFGVCSGCQGAPS